jgi:hypothetical protein
LRIERTRSGPARNSRKPFFAPFDAHDPQIGITEHTTHGGSRTKACETINHPTHAAIASLI